MVLKVPDRDYSGTSPVRLLDGILRTAAPAEMLARD